VEPLSIISINDALILIKQEELSNKQSLLVEVTNLGK